MSALCTPVNAALALFAQVHDSELTSYANDDDLFRENEHLRDVMRINNFAIVGNSIVVNNPPAWLQTITEAPFNNKVYGRWLVVIAMNILDLMGQVDSIFWSAFDSEQTQVSASVTERGLELFFWLPLDTALAPEARFFIQHLLDLHAPDTYLWAEEREFDLEDASHNIEWRHRAVSMDRRIELTEVQSSTVQWLRQHLDKDGTLAPLFMTYMCLGHRYYYSQELGCLTLKNMRLWDRRCVLLADNMAGKDTAVAVYLHSRTTTRSVGAVIICADENVHAQWVLKLTAQRVQAYVMTYTEIQRERVRIPPASVLILDSALTFRAVISKFVPVMEYKRVIYLAAFAPTVELAWQLLVPSGDETVESIWYRTLNENNFLNELWNACVLTHEELMPNDRHVWNTHVVPMRQPRLYERWKKETLAYYSQLLDPNAGNTELVLGKAIRRMQLGLLGYVEAPRVHYQCRFLHIECSICLEPEARVPTRTACRHTFCAVCIRQWLERNESCPLCRGEVEPLRLIPVQADMIDQARVPFVQKQLKIMELLQSVNKAIVVSRHSAILESLARTWERHPTFYSNSEFCTFQSATRGIWFAPINVLYRNYDVNTTIDLVLCLEPYALTHAVVYSVQRMFTFQPVQPTFAMVASDADVDKIVPEINVVGHMWSLLQST
jgi:hypothetical protein